MESCFAGVVVGASAVGGGSSLFSWLRQKTSTTPEVKDALPEVREPREPASLQKPGVASEAQVQKAPELKGERNGPKVSSRARIRDQPADMETIGMAGAKLNVKEFVDLLDKLIGESKYLQNNPKMGVHPEEARAAKHVFDFLAPYSSKNGGPLKVERLEYVPGRTNVKITYSGDTSKNIGFIGSHMDVVPANPELWDRDPFVLTVEGDRCYGRGTTDCLCHVALLSCLLKDMCLRKAKVKRSIVMVFIAGEEGGESGVGVDRVMEAGKLDELQGEPIYWIDAADSQPCAGTFGVLQWTLKATGRLFHSGMPHKTINPIELLHESLNIIQNRFYGDFGPRYEEKRWGFTSSSTMKPTQTECAKGSLNQIPPWATCSGDIRLSPFYDIHEVIDKVEQYVNEINENLENVPSRGPCSKYILDDPTVDIKRGTLELTWSQSKEEADSYEGVACDLSSDGHKALVQATYETLGLAKPYSISGSLPLVRQMQRKGFNLDIDGFGLMSTYHANNEYCLIPDMVKAYEIILRVITLLNNT